jgi:hypothetical protein
MTNATRNSYNCSRLTWPNVKLTWVHLSLRLNQSQNMVLWAHHRVEVRLHYLVEYQEQGHHHQDRLQQARIPVSVVVHLLHSLSRSLNLSMHRLVRIPDSRHLFLVSVSTQTDIVGASAYMQYMSDMPQGGTIEDLPDIASFMCDAQTGVFTGSSGAHLNSMLAAAGAGHRSSCTIASEQLLSAEPPAAALDPADFKISRWPASDMLQGLGIEISVTCWGPSATQLRPGADRSMDVDQRPWIPAAQASKFAACLACWLPAWL